MISFERFVRWLKDEAHGPSSKAYFKLEARGRRKAFQDMLEKLRHVGVPLSLFTEKEV